MIDIPISLSKGEASDVYESDEPILFADLSTARSIILRGRSEILAVSSQLEVFAGKVGQPGAMHGLECLLDDPYASRKTPYLVCFLAAKAPHGPICAEHLLGSVLFLEYRIGGWNTGLFATGDNSGVRTVIARSTMRSAVAMKACTALLCERASIVLASFKQPESNQHESWSEPLAPNPPTKPNLQWATQTRQIQDCLPLKDTFDETLATLGKRTRTHLRYYRRRLEAVCPCDYVMNAALEITASELQTLNRESLDPLSPELCTFRYRSVISTNDGFVSGLRARDGRWLGLIGGWRQNGSVIIQWQMNSSKYQSCSLVTVLRAFCIEHEIDRGSTKLTFHGGTSHSMHHAFPSERIVDLVVRRRSLLSSVIIVLIPRLLAVSKSLSVRGNFLADGLGNKNLKWHTPYDQL